MRNKWLIWLTVAVLAIGGYWLINNLLTSGSVSEESEMSVKEFSMDSFVEFIDEQPKPQFSLKEITVNQGDLVRLTVTVTAGNHNFNLDEFNVHAETPLNEPVTVEFVADRAGEFEYYCNMPGHRAAGHVGKLIVQ